MLISQLVRNLGRVCSRWAVSVLFEVQKTVRRKCLILLVWEGGVVNKLTFYKEDDLLRVYCWKFSGIYANNAQLHIFRNSSKVGSPTRQVRDKGKSGLGQAAWPRHECVIPMWIEEGFKRRFSAETPKPHLGFFCAIRFVFWGLPGCYSDFWSVAPTFGLQSRLSDQSLNHFNGKLRSTVQPSWIHLMCFPLSLEREALFKIYICSNPRNQNPLQEIGIPKIPSLTLVFPPVECKLRAVIGTCWEVSIPSGHQDPWKPGEIQAAGGWQKDKGHHPSPCGEWSQLSLQGWFGFLFPGDKCQRWRREHQQI